MDIDSDWSQATTLLTDNWNSCPTTRDNTWATESFDLGMDLQLNRQLEYSPPIEAGSLEKAKKRRRGRKPLRPQDPIKKKTEEKDKYWLRAFRAYMQTIYKEVDGFLCPQEREFWKEHLSAAGKPEKGNRYLSYGRKYKDYLFSHPTFVYYFQKWFSEFGEAELSKKCSAGSDLWFVFYDYASRELYNYRPQSPDEPETTQDASYSEEFTLHVSSTDEFVDLVLNQI